VLAVLACCLFSIACWTARNGLALGGFVPLKSNLWFDFHQANVLDPDGVVADSTFFRHHPVLGHNAAMRAAYRTGELEFMSHYKQMSARHLREHPEQVLKKFANRLLNATVLLKRELEMEPAKLVMEPQVQAYLVGRRLAVGGGGGVSWCSLDLEPEVLQRELLGVPPEQRERLYNDWRRARKAQREESLAWSRVLWGLAHALLPALAILVSLARTATRRHSGFLLATGLYALYLTPYVLVSHYSRYQMGLIALFSYLIWLAGRSRPGGKPSGCKLPAESAGAEDFGSNQGAPG
jgi:hypothetical protein